MKRILTILLCTCCFLTVHPLTVSAQTDTSLTITDSTKAYNETTNVEDDEFNLFLFVIALGFIGAMFGAAVVIAFIAMLFLLVAVLFVSLGIISASFIVGLYKKSFEIGFNTYIYITSIVLGAIIGSIGFWLIDKIFNLEITESSALISGGIAGVISGLIISFMVVRLIRIASKYVMNKLNAS